MFCTDKTYAFCTEFNSLTCIFRCICICTDGKSSSFICPLHECSEVTGDCSWNSCDFTFIDKTCGAINRNDVTFMECLTIDCEYMFFFVDCNITASGYTACTHTTGNNCCMRCHTTTDCNNRFRNMHTFDIFRRCFKSDKNNLLAVFNFLLGIFSCEYNSTTTSTWRSSKTLGNDSFLSCL